MNDLPYNHVFRDLLADRISNSPQAWGNIAGLFDRFSEAVKGMVLPNLGLTVNAAADATGALFCTVMVAKNENIDLGFHSMVNEAPGRSFGARLINWTIGKMGLEVAVDLQHAWKDILQQMGSAIEVMIRKLEPRGPTITPEEAAGWIKRHGGIGKLHMDYLSLRRQEAASEKLARERDRKAGAEMRKLSEAKEAGFDTVEAYEVHVAKVAQEERDATLRARFDELKKGFVSTGTQTVSPPEMRLLIVCDGRIYALSDKDEFALLSCAASVM